MISKNRKLLTVGLLAVGMLGLGVAAWFHQSRPHGTISSPASSAAVGPAAPVTPASGLKPSADPQAAPVDPSTQVSTRKIPGSGSGRKPGQPPTPQEIQWTAQAKPTAHTSLLLLDLTRPPSEKELRMSGQLGEELQPIGPADPAAVADPKARRRLEAINKDFGAAIQEWNRHHYEMAMRMFLDHLTAYHDSPWAAESELHLGCACQYLGQLDQSQSWFEAAQSRAPEGDPMTEKATLRLGALAMDQGNLEKSSKLFAQLKAAADSSSHATYASYWIRALSLMKAKQTSMRDCGQKSLGEICALMGREDDARALRSLPASGPDGFSMDELEHVAREHGLKARTVFAEKRRLEDMPLPFIAHYLKDEHFVAVLGRQKDGKIRIYDTRVGHVVDADASYLAAHWSGFAMVFSPATADGVRIASVQEKREALGGCCGLPRYPNDLGPCGNGGCSSCSRGMPSRSVNPLNMNLVVSDTPMWWDAPYGPSVNFTLTYNSLDSLITVRPFGDKWAFNYSEYAIVDPSGSVMIIRGNAKAENFVPDLINGGYQADPHYASTTLTKLGDYSYVMEESDGTKYTYSVPTNMGTTSVASLLTSIADKYGTTVTIGHNPQGAVISVTHPAAGTWNIAYGDNGKVSSIADPFNRTATFTYDVDNHLTGQTDMGGVAYGYTYTTAAKVKEQDLMHPGQFVTRTNELFLNALVLPTGVHKIYTEPADGLNAGIYPPAGQPMWENYRITITDPLNVSEEYFYDGYHRLSWYRDKNHYKAGEAGTVKTVYGITQPTGDSKGEISSTSFQGGGATSSNQYTSGGNPQSITGRDGRVDQYTYNDKGNILTHTTADGILYTSEYAANGLDVVKTKRKVNNVEVITSQTAYDPVTRDVTSATDQAGLTTTYVRNSHGQLTSSTDARGNTASYEFDARGFLQTVRYLPAGRGNPIVRGAYVYDDAGRLVAQTNQVGYVMTFECDTLNRTVKTTYPDNTTVVNNYSCCTLDSTKARDGSMVQYTYDALKRVTSMTSPGPQVMKYTYDNVGNLLALNFGRGEGVRWKYDDANRRTAKIYPDGTQQTYAYDAVTGRMISSTDAQNRSTTIGYDSNGQITSLTPPNLPVQKFTYDSTGQCLTWTDGTGASARTTSYIYDALGRATGVQLPGNDGTIAYSYDQWGRLDHWTFGATGETLGTETYTYDDLDRTATVTNPLGSFAPVYDGDTGTVTRMDYPVAGLYTQYTRLGVNQDQRLSQILHHGTVGELARFDYAYDASGGISQWSASQAGLTTPRQWGIGYDPAHLMTSVEETPRGAAIGTVPQRVWRYAYDASGNRVTAQEGGRTATAGYNNLNQLTQLVPSGSTWFRGKINEAAQVTVAGQPAQVSADGTFESVLPLGPGLHDVPIQATDKAGNVTSQTWRVDNGSDAVRTFSYDGDGNLLADDRHTYTWDANNRMSSVRMETNTWAFVYDGSSRRISEKKNGVVVREWVWNGTVVLEERLTGGKKLRFWTGGYEILDSGNLQTGKRFLFSDHLGSPRVVVDGGGAVTASYDYTAWGQRTGLSGTEAISVGYTGQTWHESGLSLAVFRTYDPALGRWPSRDPMAEQGDVNVYRLSYANPVTYGDYLGLKAIEGIEIGQQFCGCQKELQDNIDWANKLMGVYTKCGADKKNKTAQDIETCVDNAIGKTQVAGTTDANGNVKVNPQPGKCGPLIEKGTELHENSHKQDVLQLQKLVGANTPAFNSTWGSAAFRVSTEVKAYGTEIPFYQAVIAELNAICKPQKPCP